MGIGSIIVLVMVGVGGLILLFSGGMNSSSIITGTTSIKQLGGSVGITGKIVSVTYKGKVIWGDSSLPPNSSNEITQNGLSLRGGHVVITSRIKSLSLNGKDLDF